MTMDQHKNNYNYNKTTTCVQDPRLSSIKSTRLHVLYGNSFFFLHCISTLSPGHRSFKQSDGWRSWVGMSSGGARSLSHCTPSSTTTVRWPCGGYLQRKPLNFDAFMQIFPTGSTLQSKLQLRVNIRISKWAPSSLYVKWQIGALTTMLTQVQTSKPGKCTPLVHNNAFTQSFWDLGSVNVAILVMC